MRNFFKITSPILERIENFRKKKWDYKKTPKKIHKNIEDG
jgi:uncharacterized membrane protein